VTTELASLAVVETTPSAIAFAEPAVRLDAVPVRFEPGPEKFVAVIVPVAFNEPLAKNWN
jgi:hypothetical protein